MKKYFTVLLCTFVFLFNDFSIHNANMFAKDEKVLVKCNYLEEVKQELVEVKQEEAEDTTAIQTSTSDEYIEEDNTVTETYSENYGTYGRLYVSWFDVALYDYNVNTNSSSSLQELVDNYDSAAYYVNGGKLIIADHNYQGFSVLGSLSEGTTSYIKFADGSTIAYSLIKKAKGYNTGPDLVDTEGNSFFDMDASLIMYTCYEDGIMVTLWV
ncbi:MAG: hypothetical protein J6O56_00715 [Bacilli bacterium]|nr:hypothetical protein [Bacilli bacterium]